MPIGVRAVKFEVRLSTIGEALYASDTRDSHAYKSAQEIVLSKKLTHPNLATVSASSPSRRMPQRRQRKAQLLSRTSLVVSSTTFDSPVLPASF
jgi:hypothetical protein